LNAGRWVADVLGNALERSRHLECQEIRLAANSACKLGKFTGKRKNYTYGMLSYRYKLLSMCMGNSTVPNRCFVTVYIRALEILLVTF